VSGDAPNIPVTGIAASSAVGSVTVVEGAGADVNVTGISSSTSTNDVSVSADSSVSLTGLESTSAVDSVTATGVASVPVTGLQATGIVNGLILNETVYIQHRPPRVGAEVFGVQALGVNQLALMSRQQVMLEM
jgi:hypothetical protein